MSLAKVVASLHNAWHGVVYVYKNEHNFRLHVIISILALILSYFLGIRRNEQILVVLLIFAVLTMEILNTALENFLDLLKPRLNYQVQIVKDILAAAVLFSALAALILGIIIFLPYLVPFLFFVNSV